MKPQEENLTKKVLQKLPFINLTVINYQRNTLCTVALSKKLIPEAPSHSLGKLCRFIGIPMSDRHRANGDALATIQLFKLLLEKDTDKSIIQKSIKYADNRHVKQRYLKILDKLPEKEGLFYVHSEQGVIIFIGRGKNIKHEVNKLLLKDSPKGLKIIKRIHEITYQETGNLLFTRLKYHLELLKLKPKYNVIRKPKISTKNFNHDNLLVIDKGRTPEENAVILIENNMVVGYAYTSLAFQENQLAILKPMLTPIENTELAKTIIKNYLLKNKVSKIVRLAVENQ